MHFRQKLTFMALGSILTIAGYLLATLTSDVTAQPETDKSEPLIVDEIVCQQLSVVDENNKTCVVIAAVLNSGFMFINRADGEIGVSITSNDADNGGLVTVFGKSMKGAAQLTANEYGGMLNITGKTDNKSRVLISINERGHGTINTWDKNSYRTRP